MKKQILFLTVLIFSLTGAMQTAQAKYNKAYIGEMSMHNSVYEDTFVRLARENNLGFVEMRAANPGVDPWLPGSGTKLTLPTQHLLPDGPKNGIVINLPEMRLFAYVNGDGAPSTFPIGVGREGLNTPIGTTKVVRKVEGPTWRPTPRMRKEKPELPEVVHPGPDNPMGTHAMYLGWPQYAIHGTNKPYGIGRRSSSGCIRMYPEGIVDIYDKIPVGTTVTVVNQPIKVGWIGDELFIEAHPGIEQAIEMEEMGRVEAPKLTQDELDMIIRKAGGYRDRLRWPAIRKAVRERTGYPVPIARKSSIDEQEEAKSSPEQQKPDDIPETYSLKELNSDIMEEHNDTAVKKSPRAGLQSHLGSYNESSDRTATYPVLTKNDETTSSDVQ